MEAEILARCGQGEREIQLQRRFWDGEWQYELISNGVFIMASYNALSSQLLADFPLTELGLGQRPCRVLVGGLGLGYTVSRACRWPQVTGVDVVEINPHIIQLNRGPLAQLNGHCLEDPRVRVLEGDIFDHISRGEAEYELICMDVDNGPMQLLLEQNRRVYAPDFYAQVRRRLRPGGVFVVWSCNPAAELQEDMRTAFGQATEKVVYESHQGRETAYYLYYGLK